MGWPASLNRPAVRPGGLAWLTVQLHCHMAPGCGGRYRSNRDSLKLGAIPSQVPRAAAPRSAARTTSGTRLRAHTRRYNEYKAENKAFQCNNWSRTQLQNPAGASESAALRLLSFKFAGGLGLGLSLADSQYR